MSGVTLRAGPSALREAQRRLGLPKVQVLHAGLLPFACAALLSLVGLEAIATTEPGLAARQGSFLLVGIVGAVLLAAPSYRWAESWAWGLYLVAMGLLVFVMLPGVPDWLVHPRNGARRWINAGVTQLQPSEVAKVATVLALAAWLRSTDHHRTLRGFAIPFALALAPAFLVLVEPDLGTALLFAPALVAMIVAAGAKKRHVAGVLLAAMLAVPISYPLLKPHQRDRVDALIAQVKGDDRYARTIGFQADRAVTLAGAGGLTGQGEERASLLVRKNALPEEHNDMVFAVVCCRWGLVGGVATWLLSLGYALGGLLVAANCRDPFGRLVATGFAAMLFTQMLVNTAMTIGLLPITGITLPFVSYGGTSLLTCWLMTGILFAIGAQRRRMFERASFEYGRGS